MCPPPSSGSHYYNYKHTYSIVLMAVAGPNYEVVYADIGTNGRVSDGGVWNKCCLLKSLENGSLNIPEPKPLPHGTDPVPHVLVGDDAFALRPFVMKSYPQGNLTIERRVFNYRYVHYLKIIYRTLCFLSKSLSGHQLLIKKDDLIEHQLKVPFQF